MSGQFDVTITVRADSGERQSFDIGSDVGPASMSSRDDIARFSLRMPLDLAERVRKKAEDEHRSMNAQLLDFITTCLERNPES